ncbi:MAG: recombinase RecA [Polyangiaceae bacterium]
MTDDKAKKQKAQALSLAISAVEKEFGKGSIMRLKDGKPLQEDVPSVPSGSLSLDIGLGIGGYPRGRIIEVYGPESSGKTTLTLHAIANVQKQGGIAAFIDAEHALDLSYARKLGVDTEELLIAQPDYGEQALEIADMLVRSGTVDCVVIDSVAALVPKAELEGDMGDSHVGLQARLMSQALRKLTGSLNKSRCAMFFINQLRMKIGVMFGSPETTTGGNALKFYSSVRLRVSRIGSIKEAGSAGRDPQVVGNRTRVKIVKNKLAPPFRECEFDILYGTGICHSGDVLDLATELGIVEKSGSWFSFRGERLGQGREKVRGYLEENPALLLQIENMVRAKNELPIIGGVSPEVAPAASSDDGDDDTTDDPAKVNVKANGKARARAN